MQSAIDFQLGQWFLLHWKGLKQKTRLWKENSAPARVSDTCFHWDTTRKDISKGAHKQQKALHIGKLHRHLSKICKTGREKDGFASQGEPEVVPIFINQSHRIAAISIRYTSNSQAHSCQHIRGPSPTDSRI